MRIAKIKDGVIVNVEAWKELPADADGFAYVEWPKGQPAPAPFRDKTPEELAAIAEDEERRRARPKRTAIKKARRDIANASTVAQLKAATLQFCDLMIQVLKYQAVNVEEDE